MTITGTNVQFVRAKVPLRYLRALENPSLVLQDTIVIKQSPPLDVLIPAQRGQLLIALAAVIDEYYQDIRLSLTKYRWFGWI